MASEEASVDYDTLNKDPLEGVEEISPNKRYIRFQHKLEKSQKFSKYQSSYKAFDTKNGIEVAWHIIKLNVMKENEQSQFIQCINIIKNIQSKYITEFLAHWFDKSNHILNIITSDLSILKDFINKVIITLRWKIVKRWCKQILKGLDVLHQSNPKIIHRNICCRHIYIDSGLGEISLGDLWFSAILDSDNNEPIGLKIPLSPAYCSSESLKNNSTMKTTKADIYSFGMCVLEMLCGEEPYYHECSDMTKDELINHICSGNLPLCMHRILHPQAYDFIHSCLKSEQLRPSALELLQHQFLRVVSEEDDKVVILGPINNNINNNEEISKLSQLNYNTSLNSNIIHTNQIQANDQSFINSQILNNNPVYPIIDGDTSNEKVKQEVSTKLKNDLMNGLATIQESENVHHDKGIQDGRRSDVNTTTAKETTNISNLPPIQDTTNKVKIKKEKIRCAVTKIGKPELHLAMTIPSSLSNKPPIDGNQNLQVEFEFDTTKDIYENVASEMVVEVDLLISAIDLAKIIRDEVEKVLDSNEYKSLINDLTNNNVNVNTDNVIDNKGTGQSDNAVNNNIDKELESKVDLKRVDSKKESILVNKTDSITIKDAENKTDHIINKEYSKDINELIKSRTVSIDKGNNEVSINMINIPSNLTVNISSNSLSSHSSAYTSKNDLTNLNVTSDTSPNSKLSNNLYDINQSSNPNNNIDISTVPPINQPISPSSNISNNKKIQTNENDDNNEETNKHTNQMDTTIKANTINKTTSIDINIDNELELIEYLDKLEKEARIARRTFEQRIQKHQSIQENCEEELQQIEDQYQLKLQEFERKEINSLKKKDEEIIKLKLDTDEKIQKLKNEKKFFSKITSSPIINSQFSLQSSSSLPVLSLNPTTHYTNISNNENISIISKSGSHIYDKKSNINQPVTPNKISKNNDSTHGSL